MARFKYMGVSSFPGITFQACTRLALPRKMGDPQVLTPVPPATEFVVGQDIGYEIDDSRSIEAMRADPRFSEV